MLCFTVLVVFDMLCIVLVCLVFHAADAGNHMPDAGIELRDIFSTIQLPGHNFQLQCAALRTFSLRALSPH